MNNFTNLVQSINSLFTSDFSPSDETVAKFGEKLAKHVTTRIAEERSAPTLRLSNIGKPDRQLWYTINKPEAAETLPPETRFKFLYGDILEELMLFLAEQAGYKVENQQREVSLNGVKGHIDGTINGILVDCKSASTYSFNRFKEGLRLQDDSFGYIYQLQSYLEASRRAGFLEDESQAGFLVNDKTLGKLHLDIHKRWNFDKDSTDWDEIIDYKKSMVNSPELPKRCFPDLKEGEKGNRKLGLVCEYCPFKKTCWPGLKGFLYSAGRGKTKPVYLTKVVYKPKVPEFDI